ncbi:hypothetical protein OTK49_02555 [Vibrio coralliirubri]|uniref:hypothetical protein n=1 Tax=Vibrio coralliirubri TaxID=1516159 RepID=UPI002283B940|nr:hypothetical protein [Vibrio coralliirubri]MCY9861398.1 hypothetical protein [Vibrio coralliirubri]
MSKKFDLSLALKGSKVLTRDGRLVTDIKVVDEKAPHSASVVDDLGGEPYTQGITVVIHNKCGASVYPYYHDGGSHLYGGKTDADLVMA